MTALNTILKRSSFLVFGQIYFAIVNVLVLMGLTRLLSIGDFGTYTYAQSVILMVSVFGYFGVQKALTQFTASNFGEENYSGVKSVFCGIGKDAITMNLFLSIVVFTIAIYFGDRLFGQPGVGLVIAVLALTYPIRAIVGVLVPFFEGLGLMHLVAFLQSVSEPSFRLIAVTFMLLASYNELSQWVFAIIITLVLHAMVAVFLYRKFVPTEIKSENPSKFEREKIYRYALPYFVSSLTLIAMNNIDVVMLGYFAGVEDVAIYRVYKVIVTMGIAVVSTFTIAYHPMIAQLISEGKSEELIPLYKEVSRWMAYIGVLGFLFMLLFGPFLAEILFGAAYSLTSIAVIVMLSTTILFNSLVGPHWASLMATGKTKSMAAISFASLMALLFCGLVMIPRFGLAGAAAAYLASQVTINMLGLWYVKRISQLSPVQKPITHLIILGTISAIAGIMIVSPELEGFTYTFERVLILTSILVVFCLLSFYGIFTASDRDLCSSFGRRCLSAFSH